MIYQIYYNSDLIYDPRLTDDEDYLLAVRDATLTLGLNSAGSLVFTIDKKNPFQSSLQLMRGKVKVVQSGTTDTTLFIGRIVNLEKNFDLSMTVTCEGALAWTNDSYLDPYIFPGSLSPTGNYVEWLLNRIITFHNGQRWSAEGRELTLGTVTVTAPSNFCRKRDKRTSVWTALKEDFIESDLGGYFRVRYSGDTVYLDYLAAASGTNNQPIEYSLNLLDITDDYSGADMFNAIYPVGKDAAGNEISISSVSDGYYDEDGNYSATYQTGYRYYKQARYILDYESRDTYGVIFREAEYEGIEDADDVFNAGIAALNAHVDVVPRTVTVSAIDLANVTDDPSGLGIVYNSMTVGALVNVYSAAHGLDTSMILSELTIDICNPESSTVTLGSTTSATLTSSMSDTDTDKKDSVVLLWKNPNPTATAGFSAQTVTVTNLSSYGRFMVVYRWGNTDDSSQGSRTFVRSTESEFRCCCDISDASQLGVRSRRFSILSTAPNDMVWEDGKAIKITDGTQYTGPKNIIPLYVYGLN